MLYETYLLKLKLRRIRLTAIQANDAGMVEKLLCARLRCMSWEHD